MGLIAPLMTFGVFVVTLLSCVSDFRSLRIPNWHCLTAAALFVPAWLAMPQAFAPLWQHLAGMGIFLAITYIMFAAGMMGGGDSKLGAALGLWAGVRGLLPFVFYMTLVGGVLALVAFVLRNKKVVQDPRAGSWLALLAEGRSVVPYGIAISAGAWAAFFHTGLVHNQINEVFKIIH